LNKTWLADILALVEDLELLSIVGFAYTCDPVLDEGAYLTKGICMFQANSRCTREWALEQYYFQFFGPRLYPADFVTRLAAADIFHCVGYAHFFRSVVTYPPDVRPWGCWSSVLCTESSYLEPSAWVLPRFKSLVC
jgi:hypothetical protein